MPVLLAASLAVSATALPASGAWAEEATTTEGFYVVSGGSFTPVPEEVFLDLDSTPSSTSEQPGQAGTYLISFPQWFSCFTLNDESELFAQFTYFRGATQYTKQLRCGTAGWGYKHIMDRHQQDWQNKLDVIQSLGMGLEYSWDDVMAAGAYASLDYSDFIRVMPESNKECAVGELAYLRSDGTVLQYFNVTTVIATDSSRIITSYPSSKSVC